MARRRILEEPVSRLAIWARRIALFSLVATVLAIIVVRAGVLEIGPALTTFAGALGLAVIALILAFAAFVVIWRQGSGGMGYALSAIALSLALLAYPSYLGLRSYNLPRIADITTNPQDAPRYESRARPREANPIVYAGPEIAELQQVAWPDIEPLDADAPPPATYAAALAVIKKHRWLIVYERPPQPRRDGQIEAVARSAILGFRDDVVVRVRAEGEGSRVDVRSSARYGSFDFGANAERVRALLEEIDDAIGNQKPSQPAAAAAKKQKGQPKADAPTGSKQGGQPSAKR